MLRLLGSVLVSAVWDLAKLRGLMVQAEHGGMTDELLDEIELVSQSLFTGDVVRLVKVLAYDARKWRKRAGEK